MILFYFLINFDLCFLFPVYVQEIVGGSYSKCFSTENFFHLFYHLKTIVIACIVAILKFSLIPHSYLLDFKFYCVFLYHLSKLWPFLSLSANDFLEWVIVISYFDHCSLLLYSKSSSAHLPFRNCFTRRLGTVRLIYSSSVLPLNSRKCFKTF